MAATERTGLRGGAPLGGREDLQRLAAGGAVLLVCSVFLAVQPSGLLGQLQKQATANASGASFIFSYQPAREAPASPNIFEAVSLGPAEYPMAKCLDGSDYVYFHRKATTEAAADKWVFHIQGGGWCPNAEDCAGRAATYLGSSVSGCKGCTNSSTQDIEVMEGCEGNRWCGPLLSDSPATNPIAHDWNAVVVRYCDGASFTGSAGSPLEHNGQSLFFRGQYNLQGVFADLTKSRALGSASRVIIGGDSAGGLATFLHLDRMADWIYQANAAAGLEKANVLGMPVK